MPKKQASYKELKIELDRVLSALQHEDTDLDEAIQLHKQGEEVLAKIETYLQQVSDDAHIKQP